jgi:hypothetical protein
MTRNTDPVARRALYVPQKHAFSLGTPDVSATRQQALETAEVFLGKRFTTIIGQTLAAAETHPTVPFVPAHQMSAHFAPAANSSPFRDACDISRCVYAVRNFPACV